MSIAGVRYDERLIHGQVVTFWTNTLHIDRIVVLDPVANNDTMKAALRIAVPKGINSSIISEDIFIHNYLSGKYGQQRLFIILRDISIVVKLVKSGIDVKELNLGNRSKKCADDIIITNHFALDIKDLDLLKNLHGRGVYIYSKLTPQEKAVFKFEELLKDGDI